MNRSSECSRFRITSSTAGSPRRAPAIACLVASASVRQVHVLGANPDETWTPPRLTCTTIEDDTEVKKIRAGKSGNLKIRKAFRICDAGDVADYRRVA
jgi:hypothetical protein